VQKLLLTTAELNATGRRRVMEGGRCRGYSTIAMDTCGDADIETIDLSGLFKCESYSPYCL
jgi:hypothetical protein